MFHYVIGQATIFIYRGLNHNLWQGFLQICMATMSMRLFLFTNNNCHRLSLTKFLVASYLKSLSVSFYVYICILYWYFYSLISHGIYIVHSFLFVCKWCEWIHRREFLQMKKWWWIWINAWPINVKIYMGWLCIQLLHFLNDQWYPCNVFRSRWLVVTTMVKWMLIIALQCFKIPKYGSVTLGELNIDVPKTILLGYNWQTH